jgi:hypothetical protein
MHPWDVLASTTSLRTNATKFVRLYINPQHNTPWLVRKDGEGYLAEVVGYSDLYAFGYSEREALSELLGVIDTVSEMKGPTFKRQVMPIRDVLKDRI